MPEHLHLPELLRSYRPLPHCFDEVFDADGQPRPHYQALLDLLAPFAEGDFQTLNESVRLAFFNQGITFAVYNEGAQGTERIFPFDLFPRIIPAAEWDHLARGVEQRNRAMNLFLHDLYHERRILKAGIVPPELIYSSGYFNKQMVDFDPVGEIYSHISGTDIIRHKDGQYYVLEDNIRSPSGVSYVLANRNAMKTNLATFFQDTEIARVPTYPMELLATIQSVAPPGIDKPTAVVLTPGVYNSAYYEHSFLAQHMGLELVEGRDLYVDEGYVFMKTIYGPRRVHVIYRRIDDDFLDPMVYRTDSALGVAGLMEVYRAGRVSIVNAPGTGVADDKAVYAYMPEIIQFYLGETAILANVPTYRCEEAESRAYVLDHLDELVIKPVDESGGYGIVIGHQASEAELTACRAQILAQPRKYIAQPIMSLSTHATYIAETGTFEPRHVDLRIFSLLGKDRFHLLKGGLTRVALRRGSLIVNSSQGGGSKDTWVLEH